jgi:hypothetical protein
MRILVLTGHDEAYAEVNAVSWPNKRAYCERHGYRFACYSERPGHGRPAFWDKIAWSRNHLAEVDWLFWTDADSLVCNQDVRLESFLADADLIARREVSPGEDFESVLTGEFLLRSCPWSKRLLEEVWAQEQFTDLKHYEQAALTHLWRTQAWVAERVMATPGRGINAFAWEYEPGDFIVHFPGMGTPLERAGHMREFAARHGVFTGEA